MVTLNTIFREEGLDLNRIQLIRHQDSRLGGKSLFDVWFSDREEFERYQCVQRKKFAFDVGGFVASFVVTGTRDTLFVGMYTVTSRRQANAADHKWGLPPLTPTDVFHEMRLVDDLSHYVRRLVIEPWNDPINYVKRAVSQHPDGRSAANPIVREIKRTPEDEQFPGLIEFSRRIDELESIFPSWTKSLKEHRGIYLLTFDDGQLYVGSASGEEGFWQQWKDYARDGHGGNQVLRHDRHDARKATVSILEFTGSAATKRDRVGREMIWQMKLGSRAKRLDDE